MIDWNKMGGGYRDGTDSYEEEEEEKKSEAEETESEIRREVERGDEAGATKQSTDEARQREGGVYGVPPKCMVGQKLARGPMTLCFLPSPSLSPQQT